MIFVFRSLSNRIPIKYRCPIKKNIEQHPHILHKVSKAVDFHRVQNQRNSKINDSIDWEHNYEPNGVTLSYRSKVWEDAVVGNVALSCQIFINELQQKPRYGQKNLFDFFEKTVGQDTTIYFVVNGNL